MTRNTIIKSSAYSYIIVPSMLCALAIFFLVHDISDHNPGIRIYTIGSFVLLFLWIIWLSGFHLCIHENYFEYRNGFYMEKRILLEEIVIINRSHQNAGFRKGISLPSIIIEYASHNSTGYIDINPTPFHPLKLKSFLDQLEEARRL